MKNNKLFLLVILVGLLNAFSTQARSFYISNIQGDVVADYTNVNDLLPNIQDGDTLYFAGSFSNYASSNVTISKRVVIIGSGFYLHENAPLEATEMVARFGGQLVLDGSASGTVIIGMSLKNISCKVAELTLQNCLLDNGTATNVTVGVNMTNLKINQCFLRGNVFASSTYTIANLEIKNSALKTPTINKVTSGVLDHNIIFTSNTSWTGVTTIDNSTISNSIFLTEPSGGKLISGQGNTLRYNAFIASQSELFNTTDAANNTVEGNNIYDTFHSTYFAQQITSPTDFGNAGANTSLWGFSLKLADNSPAKGKGLSGTDIGMFGGSNPFVLGGVSTPYISELDIDPAGSTNRNINYKLKAFARNFSQATPGFSRIEYFIDTDPGKGKGTNILLVQGGNSVDADASIDISGVAEGVHIVYFRAVDSQGLWSTTYSRPFYKMPKLLEKPANTTMTAAEYFIDTDPGPGKGKAITLANSGTDITQEFDMDTTGLDRTKKHTLYVRVKDNTGRWSVEQSVEFELTPNSAVTSIDDLIKGGKFKVYPNPTVNWLQVDFGTAPKSAATLIVRDVQGKVLHKQVAQANTRTQRIQVKGFTPGLYYLELTDGKSYIVRKFIVR